MDISAHSGQNKVTKMCPKYLLTIVSVPNLAKSNNTQNYQVYIVYAITNMAGTLIVYPIYTVNLGGARSDLVV